MLQRRSFAIACGFAWLSLLLNPAKARTQQASPTTGPASRPAGVNHAELYEAARKVPLEKAVLEKDGNAEVSAEERKEFDRSEELVQSAIKLRKEGKYSEGVKPSAEALAIRKKIFGPLHPYTVTTIAVNNVLRRFAAAPEFERVQLREADVIQLQAEADLDSGEFAKAADGAAKALEIRERILGKNYFELGESLRVLGGAMTELADFARAREVLDHGVEIVEKAYGERHPKRAMMLDRRGWLRINTADYRGAIEDLQTACRIYKHLTGDTVDAAEAMDNLGTASAAAGEYRDAIDRKVRALVVREGLLGPEARDTAVSYSNLAWLYSRLGANSEVVPMRERALAIFEKALGPDHPYTSTELVNLGLSYQLSGRYDDAIKLYERAVKMDEARKAPADVKGVARTSRLGVAYFEAGRRDDGLRTMKKAVAKAQAVQRGGNPVAATEEMQKIATVFENYRLLEEAVRVLQEARQWDQDRKGPVKDSQLGRAERLGHLLTSLGRAKEARDILVTARDQVVSSYGKDDRRCGPIMLALAFAYMELGELADAEKICDEVLRMSETKFGAGSKANAFALRAMASVYVKQKRNDLAKFTLDDARKIIQSHQEDDPVEMIRFLLDYAEWQGSSGDRTGGVETSRDALTRARKLAEGVKTPHMDGLLCRVLKRLIDQLAASPSPAPAELSALRGELRKLLEGLRDHSALDAEETRWLQELGAATAKSPDSAAGSP